MLVDTLLVTSSSEPCTSIWSDDCLPPTSSVDTCLSEVETMWAKLFSRLVRFFAEVRSTVPSSRALSSTTSRGALSAPGKQNISKNLFISICIACPSRSFASVPNGLARSLAISFSRDMTKIWMNENSAAHTACVAHCEVTIGATTQCINNNPLHVWLYAAGKGVVASRKALWYWITPLASCWKTRVSNGGGVVSTPPWAYSMTRCWTQHVIKCTLESLSLRTCKDSWSNSSGEMSS
mmetsp:Transcript_122790/g.352665  ORF Transcript_122790/g.352665 Transcript_122790/m.352665 type:complete len:237 (-) Transcript_122790:210-920(-)